MGNAESDGGVGQILLDIGSVLGPVIGLAGLGLALVVHRRQVAAEKRDLRIRIRERRDETEQALNRLREIFEEARRSRKFVLAAAGLGKSSSMEKAERQWKGDRLAIDEAKSLVPDRNVNYDNLSEAELENRFVDLGQMKGRIDHLISKYENDLRNDDIRREQLHANRLATHRKPSSSYE